MTTFLKRPCKLGKSINTRTEMNGDDSVPACDIPIVGFMLEKSEVDQLVGKNYWNSIFEQGSRGKADQPAWPLISAGVMNDKFEGDVTIVMGLNQKDIELPDVKLTSMVLEPLPGGLVELSLKIQANKDVEKYIHKLIARMNTEIDLELAIGDKVERAKSKQQELPINSFGKDEEVPGPQDDPRAGDGIAQAEALFKSTPGRRSRASKPINGAH